MSIEEITGPGVHIQSALAHLRSAVRELEDAAEKDYQRTVRIKAGTDYLRREGTLATETAREVRRAGIEAPGVKRT